jgi:hypothetical protein
MIIKKFDQFIDLFRTCYFITVRAKGGRGLVFNVNTVYIDLNSTRRSNEKAVYSVNRLHGGVLFRG